MNWQKCAKRYEDELLNSVIPFWEKNCVDKEFGGYFTSFERDGSVYDTMKYMWMQWRIVYMFAEIYLAGHKKDEYVKIAEQGFDFLYNKGKDENGRYYFALNREGVPAMAPYSLFSDCFAAMGAAKLYKITGKELHAEAATAAMKSYVERAKSGNSALQWNKSLEGKTPYYSLGHYMMMANLGLIMKECLDTNEFDDAMDIAVDMVLNKFYSPEFGLVFENMPMNSDKPDLDSSIGRQMNPGHVLEAMWFLLNYLEQDKVKNQDKIDAILKIIENTLNFGWDKKFGGIYYFMDALGKPHLELQHDMKLWWVHNEATLACLYAYGVSGDKKFVDWFKKVDKYMWKHFADPKYGEWFAYCNRKGELTHTLKGGKWKTFFHVPRCLLFAAEKMKTFKD
jgi:N-acylglucosamine 2-epimerase